MISRIVRQLLAFLQKWFWKKPTAKDEPLKATEVINNWICIKYHDQYINLKKSEITAWNSLSRRDRRAMAQRFAVMEKKGQIKFVEINGHMTCVKNKNYSYEHQTDTRQ